MSSFQEADAANAALLAKRQETKCTICGSWRRRDDPNYPGLCTNCALNTWAKAADPTNYWGRVPCIECGLGRDCDKHPEGDGNAEFDRQEAEARR